VIDRDLGALLDLEREEGDVVIFPFPVVPLLEGKDELLGSRRDTHLLYELAYGGISRSFAAADVPSWKAVIGNV
jgi:hypothetical protein